MDLRRATGVRGIIAFVAIGMLVGSFGIGALAHSAAASGVGLVLAALSLAFAAFLLRDGRLLPRSRPLNGWERWALGGTMLLGLVMEAGALGAVVFAPSLKGASHVLIAAGLVSFAGTGVVAVIAMLRS